MTAAPSSRSRTAGDVDGSPSRSTPRSGLLLGTGSRFVKRAMRESRLIPSENPCLIDPIEEVRREPLGVDGERPFGESTRSTQEPDANSTALREPAWYEPHVPLSGLELQLCAQEPQDFTSTSNCALNWEALTTSLVSDTANGSFAHPVATDDARIPPRVLDLGCGSTPFWILTQAMQPGWEQTEFVGLDISPTSATIYLPPSYEHRVSFMQHDLHEALPFPNASFDFVRLSFVNLSLREQDWQLVCDEALRVAKPGTSLEIVESDHGVLGSPQSDMVKTMDSLFSDVLADRFVNPCPLAVIPATLITSGATSLRSTGRVSLDMGAHAKHDSMRSILQGAPTSSAEHLLDRHVSGRKSTSRALWSSETPVLLHAYADRWAPSSLDLAKAAVASRRGKGDEQQPGPLGQGRSSLEDRTEAKVIAATQEVVHAWAEELRSQADLASLLHTRLAWQPTFDVVLASALEATVEACVAGLREVETHRTLHADVFGEADPELERRWQQMEYARRDAEADLVVAKARLSGRPPDEKQELGSLVYEAFIVNAPS